MAETTLTPDEPRRGLTRAETSNILREYVIALHRPVACRMNYRGKTISF